MPFLDRQTVGFFTHFMSAYPSRSILMVLLLGSAGLFEGVGVITLLPMLEMAGGADADGPSHVAGAVGQALSALGLEPSLAVLLTVIVLAITAKAVLLWVAMRQVGHTVAQVTTDLRMQLLRTLMGVRWSYYVSQPAGTLVNAISTEAHRAASAYRSGCVFVAGILQALAYFVVAFIVAWQLALAGLATGAAFVFLLRGLVQLAREAGKDQTILIRSVVNRLTEALRGIKPIRAMGREANLLPLLERETEGLNLALQRQVSASEALRLFREPTLTLLLAVGLFFALSVGSQPFTSVLVLAFVFYRLLSTINTLQSEYQTVTIGESAFWSLIEQVRLQEREREPTRGTRPAPPLQQDIRLVNVSFGYDDRPVLRNVSLVIPSGAFVALYGPSGAGKTTIMDLIIALQQPDGGRIEIDGIPLNEVDVAEWRRKIGYVPQEVFLFHDTIYRNVALGDESLTPGDVEEALKAAGAWSFVQDREDGVHEVLGEGGARLSGGQRQRISMARALVHRPSLLVLDEATAALDPATEREILRTLQDLRGRVTVVAVSHQPAVQDAADIVYSLDRGVVANIRSRSVFVPDGA